MGQNVFFKAICWVYPIISAVAIVFITYDIIDNWFIELISYGAPLLIVGNLFALLFAALFTRKFKYILLPIVAIFISLKPISETVALHFRTFDGKSDFTVMSYNVATFNTSRMQNKLSDSLFNASIYKWFRENKSPDILCLQEFYHSDWEDYDNTLDSIVKLGGYDYFYMNPVYKEDLKGIVGIITFSKFHAIKSGEIRYTDGNAFNKGLFHDFKIKDDTIRVLNFHLNSMSIRWNDSDTLSFFQQLSYNAGNIYERLHKGYNQRKTELNEIEKFIDESPYKVLICADINSVPYSYTYQRLKSKFNNAFENAGFGLGYTCNRFPWFVRIDNQFYDKSLTIDYFKTHTEMSNSDHFPIEAGYSFR